MDITSAPQERAANLPALGERARATAAIAVVSAIGSLVYATASWLHHGAATDWLLVGIHSSTMFAASGLTIALTLLALNKIVDQFGK